MKNSREIITNRYGNNTEGNKCRNNREINAGSIGK